MTKRKYARIGDKVRIVEPKFFERCGYPLTIIDVQNKFGDEINLLRDKLTAAMDWIIPDRSHFHRYLDRAICSAILSREKFGGDERRIYERDYDKTNYDPDITGKTAIVKAKKIVMTGVRVKGSGGYSYDGEYDYDPPYLDKAKAHCVYTLDVVSINWPIQVLAERCEIVNE